jgi:hypothetical protein
MRRLTTILTAFVLAAIIGNGVFAYTSSAMMAGPQPLTPPQQRYLALARQGVASAKAHSWNGERLAPQNARPGMLQTHAATTSLFAWLAVYRPPA